jgi:phosphomannomutase
MRVDRVEVSWDAGKNKWLVRVQTGEEVVRRYCAVPKESDEQSLRSAVEKVVQDEGYEPDAARTTIHR